MTEIHLLPAIGIQMKSINHMNVFTRRIFLAAVFLFFLAGCSKDLEKQDRPNVLFVVFDDLNDWEGSLAGHPQAKTPNIDRLAEMGVLFSNAHASGTMCNPSRASVITGLRPTTTGVYKNTDTPFSLYKETQTLNKHFKDNGYFVAGAGKILHKFYYEKGDWDEFVGRHNDSNIISNRANPDTLNITKLDGSSLAWGPFSSPDSLTFDARSVDWINERINREHDEPFFLACGIFRPHNPWFVPEKYFDEHPLNGIQLPLVMQEDLEDVPQMGKNIAFSTSNFTKRNDLEGNSVNKEHVTFQRDSLWDDAIQAYLASVSYADAQFGRLLDTLEKSKYADNTIIVLWSDHGWHLGEKGHWRKGTLWEEVTRVPLIIYVPGAEKGKKSYEAVSLLDLFPTLIELCGLPQVNGLEGESLVPLLNNVNAKRDMPAVTSLGPNYHAVRDERYRFISYGDGQEELYDHVNDPEEWTNIASDPTNQELINELKKYLPVGGKDPLKGEYSN